MQISVIAPGPGSCRRMAGRMFVPYGSFFVCMRETDSSVDFPLMVQISETPNPEVRVGSLVLGGHTMLDLSRRTQIVNRENFRNTYPVDNLTHFPMRWRDIHFRIIISRDLSDAACFNGSTMNLSVRNDSGYSESIEVRILNSNPNNHFHWRNEDTYVDGWYFKCVHIDRDSRTATPFFFLYGVNNPGGGTHAESFVIGGNGGTVQLDTNLVASASGAIPSSPDIFDVPFSHTDFTGERFYGLDLEISSDFAASDRGCRGRHELPSGEIISWDLDLTTIHPHVLTDYNPLEPFKTAIEIITGGSGIWNSDCMPLMEHFVSVPGVSAYAMNHNMNCFVSGTIEWKGQTYAFNNDKGYQDENWGVSGFPHPYVWMQANNFRGAEDNALLDTSLIAFYTPGMPVPGGSTIVGAICLRHSGQVYKFFTTDPSVWNCLGLVAIGAGLADMFLYDIGTMTCSVTFSRGATQIDVNLNDPANIDSAIGPFPTTGAKRTPDTIPVVWVLAAENDNGDRISVRVDCSASSVFWLRAPFQGRMAQYVTKQSLHGKFTVEITPNGESAQTLHSDFGAVDYGD